MSRAGDRACRGRVSASSRWPKAGRAAQADRRKEVPMDSPAVLFAQIRAPRAALADYDEWYLAEHVPERLAVPGFESFERYERLDDVAAASTAHREYLTTYRVRSLAVLTSPEYLQRLDNPTPLTRRFSPLSTVVRRL